MIKKIKILFFGIFIILNLDTNLFAEKNNQKAKNNKNKRIEGSVKINFPGLTIDREFFENMIHDYPVVTSLVSGLLMGYCLYPDEYKEFMQKYRTPLFGLGSLSIMYTAWNRNKLITKTHIEELEFETMDKYTRFSQSGVRVYYPGDIKTRFKDVAGLQSAKEDLEDIKKFLVDSYEFEEIGAKVPKGILLNGEPGNGKTLLARALAGEVDCPFLYIAGTEFIETIVGNGAARVRHLFEIAKDLAPCIIFIDEIDAIGGKRSKFNMGASDSELTQTLNQILAEMDGFEQNETPIIVMGATNRASILDEALLRPGRFDRKIEINPPYFKDRYEILKIYLDKVKADISIDIVKVALATPKFSGADLAHLINEAAILAVRNGDSMVTMHHIDQARDYILIGRETKGMDISKEELWNTAVHEAGHALMYVYQKDALGLYKVTVKPLGNALGVTHGMKMSDKHSQTEAEMRADISVKLGGSVAEEMIFGHRGAGASNDLEQARYIATQMVMAFGMTQEFKDVSFKDFINNQVHLPDQIATKLHKAVSEVIFECRAVTEKTLREHKDTLLELANRLMDKGTVLGSEVYEMCKVEEPGLIYSLA
jgi:cell division protease FtsH